MDDHSFEFEFESSGYKNLKYKDKIRIIYIPGDFHPRIILPVFPNKDDHINCLRLCSMYLNKKNDLNFVEPAVRQNHPISNDVQKIEPKNYITPIRESKNLNLYNENILILKIGSFADTPNMIKQFIENAKSHDSHEDIFREFYDKFLIVAPGNRLKISAVNAKWKVFKGLGVRLMSERGFQLIGVKTTIVKGYHYVMGVDFAPD